MKNVEIAELSAEQLEELNALEAKLGVALVAYESLTEGAQSELQ